MSQDLFSSKYDFKQRMTIYGFKCWPIVNDGRVIGYLRCDVKKLSSKLAQAEQSDYWRLPTDDELLESIQEFLVDEDKIILGDSLWKSDGSLFNCYFELAEDWINPNGANFAAFVHLSKT